MTQRPQHAQRRRNIVIVGGGFAGTALVRALAPRLPAGFRLVLVSEESYTTFNPLLAEVVSASVFPEHVVAPLRQIVGTAPAHQFIMGRVGDIDPQRRRVTAMTLAGAQQLAYEHLVLAFGKRASLDLIPGQLEHALPLKLIGDAMCIRNRVLQRVARIELESDPVVRRRLGHFVVIGGGFSGVEVAGGLLDFLRQARRHYPRVAPAELRVTLLHDGARLLPELPPALGHAAARSMAARGMDLRFAARAVRIAAHGVQLADGGFIDAATVVCTVGSSPNPLVDRLGLPSQRGQVPTAPDLSVPGVHGIWAIGDCARIDNTISGEPSPPTAQFAQAQARTLADNLLRTVRGEPTRPFGYRSRGMMASIGHLKGVGLLLGVPVTGWPAWLLWRAYYLSRMPTAGRKLRIWAEWTWGMLFAADITHLRFTRTQDIDKPVSPHPG